LEEKPSYLTTDWLLAAFGQTTRAATADYERVVDAGIGRENPWNALKGQIYLGSEEFVEAMQSSIRPDQSLREIPRGQRQGVARPLEHYCARFADRDRAIAEAYRTGAYGMQAIAKHFRVGRMTVSRAVRKYGPRH
jgi:putative transposase